MGGMENLSRDQRAALRELKDDYSIVIMPADKGNAAVVMSKVDYTNKALAILERSPFERVKKCPSRKVESATNTYLWSLFQQRRITKLLYNQLHASKSPLPRFYGLAKIHKPEIPLRPVISAVAGSALYAVSKYLAQVLRPLVGQTE